jgi:hypothetical protein
MNLDEKLAKIYEIPFPAVNFKSYLPDLHKIDWLPFG